MSSDELALERYVRPGDHIVWGQGAAEPLTLTEALVDQRKALKSVNVFLGAHFSETFQPEHVDHICFSSFGAVGTARHLADAGVLRIIPCHVSQIETYIRDGQIPVDVLFLQVSPAGPSGLHSFGLTNDYLHAALAKARVVIAEISDQVPWTYGESALDPARINVAVRTSRPPVEVKVPPVGDVEKRIAAHVEKFIENGSVLQIGIGNIPDAILTKVMDRKDLGFHSGMLGDSAADLIEAGVVTNRLKTIDPGVSTTATLIGSRKLYQLADRNPAIALRHSTYIYSEGNLSRLNNLISINSALEVDLTGQVNAEAVDGRYVGATGGQGDFVRGAQRGRGGCSIIALPATAKAGQASRIRNILTGPVTTARADVDIIVTEFGAAELRARPLAERVRRIIAIAHPQLREDLERQAYELMRR